MATQATTLTSFPSLVINYLESTTGAANFLNAISLGAQYVGSLPLCSHSIENANKIGQAFDSASATLHLVKLGGDIKECSTSAQSLLSARTSKVEVTKARKQLCYDGCAVVARAYECMKCVAAIVGRTLPFAVAGIGATAFYVTDFSDLYHEGKKIAANRALLERAHPIAKETLLIKNKTEILYVKVAQTLSSIVLNTIGVLSLFFAAVIAEAPIVALGTLGVSTALLVTEVTAHFMKKRLKEEQQSLGAHKLAHV
jgi:hypothetical protein